MHRGYRIVRKPLAARIHTNVKDLHERVGAIVRTRLEATAAPPANQQEPSGDRVEGSNRSMGNHSLFLGATGDFELQDCSFVAMVRYRSRRDFVEFILTPEYAQDVDHKWAALSRSTAMATVPVVSFATVRLVPLLILIVIGLLLDRIRARSSNNP